MADSIKISLELADAAAQKALSDFISKSGQADKNFKNLGESGKSAFDAVFTGITKAIGVQDVFVGSLAAGLVEKGFESIKGSLESVIDEAEKSEQAVQNLNVALASAGLYTPKASADFQEFAEHLQDTTVFSKEAVLSSSALLLNLTALSRDGIEKATLAAVNLASTLHVDLNTATEMIAKAVDGNTTAFKKQGIEIQSGNTQAERLANVLRALTSEQDKATEQANTYAGATAKAANQHNELFAAIGKVYTQSQAAIEVQKTLAGLYQSAAKFVTDNTTAFRDLATSIKIVAEVALAGALAFGVASTAVAALGIAVTAGGGAFAFLGAMASLAWAAVTAPVTLVVAGVAAVVGITYELVHNWDRVKASTYEAIAATLEFVANSEKVFGFGDALAKQAKGYRDQAQAIREAIAESKNQVKQLTDEEKAAAEQERIRKQRLADAERDAQRHAEFLRTTAKLNNDELTILESDKYIKFAEIDAAAEQARIQRNGVLTGKQLADFLKAGADRLKTQQDLDRQELELQIAKQRAQAASETDDRKRREALAAADQKARIDRLKLSNKQELDTEKQKNKTEAELDQDRLNSRRDTLSLFTTMSQSSNQALVAVAKAAGIAQIAIDTPVAISKAFTFGTSIGGPPVGFAFGALAAAAEAEQAAKILGVNFADGGIVPGTSYSGDKVPANVNSGEMILNRQQQTELFKIANGGGNGSAAISQLASSVTDLASRPIVVQVDGRDLFNIIRSQIRGGRSFQP